MLEALRLRSFQFFISSVLSIFLLGVYCVYAYLDDDEVQIVETLRQLFERHGKPLIVVSLNQVDDFALVGWLQGNAGGHAFLHKQKSQWALLVCGGANLVEAGVLQELGMSKINAERLASAVENSERAFSEGKRLQMNPSALGVTHKN